MERNLYKVLNSRGIELIEMKLSEETSCFSFEINSLRFDLPKNMKCFENLKLNDFVYFNKNTDVDLINPVFSVVKQVIIETVFFNIDENYKFCMLEESNIDLISTFNKIFVKNKKDIAA